ncbi:MAG: hypothetical protein AB1511_12925 [Deinococcota bacterium]
MTATPNYPPVVEAEEVKAVLFESAVPLDIAHVRDERAREMLEQLSACGVVWRPFSLKAGSASPCLPAR